MGLLVPREPSGWYPLRVVIPLTLGTSRFPDFPEIFMNDFRLRVLKPRYEELFASCQIRSSWLPSIQSIAEKIGTLRSQYAPIEAQTTVPWWFVGIIHYREASFREAHLHNGDPLTGRTIRSPQGRPVALPANGITYTFVESAVDALCMMKYDKAKDRSIAAWLWRFEMWDGFDYASKGLNSEYLWNGTNHFGSGSNQGKFIAEGQFDPFAKSDQVGAAAIVWYLLHKGIIDAGAQPSFQTPPQTFSNTVSPAAVQTPSTIQLMDVFKYYRQLPHQNLAIAWFQRQLPADILAEFARRWRDNPNPVTTSTVPPTVPTLLVEPSGATNTQKVAEVPSLKTDKVQLQVPYLSQLDNLTNPGGTCNVTSVAMCMAYFGHPIRNSQNEQLEDELNQYCSANGLDRHSPADLAKVLRAYGYKDDFQSNAKWEDVKQWLNQGNPCIVHGYFTSSGHIITIIGYNQTGWIVNDPYGEWYSTGYDTSKSGAGLTYSYGMMRQICSPDGDLWIHYVSK